jgi:hypothetical protein
VDRSVPPEITQALLSDGEDPRKCVGPVRQHRPSVRLASCSAASRLQPQGRQYERYQRTQPVQEDHHRNQATC